MNIGYSSRLGYDEETYADKLEESVGPLAYRLNTNSIANCNACLSTLGPRASIYGSGVSLTTNPDPSVHAAPANNLTDIDSLLKNINVKTSKKRCSGTNPINVTNFNLSHSRICNKALDPLSSRLTYPASNYRSMSINRFYDLNKNPQSILFWNFATNTSLEAKDNYVPHIPNVNKDDHTLPVEIEGSPEYSCPTKYSNNCPS
jgi:hypothetical protein